MTKTVEELKFEGIWDKLESKEIFPDTVTHKSSESITGLHVK